MLCDGEVVKRGNMGTIILTASFEDIVSIRDQILGDEEPYDDNYEGFFVHAFEESTIRGKADLYLTTIPIDGETRKSAQAIREEYLAELKSDIPFLKIR